MSRSTRSNHSRRSFLKLAVTGAATTPALLAAIAREKQSTISMILDPADLLTNRPEVQWAIDALTQALTSRGNIVQLRHNLAEDANSSERILVASERSALAGPLLQSAGVSVPAVPEALVLRRSKKPQVLLASGSDPRGLVYAVLELADRARLASDPLAGLKGIKRVVQQPANKIRSIGRLFASDVEDKPWFNDRAFWDRYLTELATHRFNRFSLMLGLGYDFTTDITDAYFHFSYPFFVSPSGYNVRAVPLPEEERDRNLEMLRFISQETARRGLHFQLGLWTHAYKWVDSPKVNYVIEGLSSDNHASYCRDALEMLLKACPDIGGVTLRTHGESGVSEGSYEFWQTVFDGVKRSGRSVEIDLHAKGLDQKMIELALATGMPVNVSPKFWAEHMGLGYMQGAIRPQEMPPQGREDSGFFGKSTGSRRFLRYGYGDLLAEERKYGVMHRIWPGTQRLLLSGDTTLAADYGRASSFCGSLGVEWLEPLSFKGRKGSGLPGSRDAYADASLKPTGGDFEKYDYSYRVWGRHVYDPDSNPEESRRSLSRNFGGGAAWVETALTSVGRILPLVTTAHCPSAANNLYWPEMYTNMAIVNPGPPEPYSDTLSPKRFGTASPLDPEFFSRVDDFAEELLKGESSGRYSPAWVAAKLEDWSNTAQRALATAKRNVRDPHGAEFRRLAADVSIQSGLGHFFAWKFRAGVLFALYEHGKYEPALQQAIKAYSRAREAWSKLSEGARGIYRSDVTFGPAPYQRGHWTDRLPDIDADIADMQKLASKTPEAAAPDVAKKMDKAIALIWEGIKDPSKEPPKNFHSPPANFRRKDPIPLEVAPGPLEHSLKLRSIRLKFRRVNQAERWQSVEMESQAQVFRATVPGDYTDSVFPIQYYFQLRTESGAVWLVPGLTPKGSGQPYFVVRQA
jgi:hypothetical protein